MGAGAHSRADNAAEFTIGYRYKQQYIYPLMLKLLFLAIKVKPI